MYVKCNESVNYESKNIWVLECQVQKGTSDVWSKAFGQQHMKGIWNNWSIKFPIVPIKRKESLRPTCNEEGLLSSYKKTSSEQSTNWTKVILRGFGINQLSPPFNHSISLALICQWLFVVDSYDEIRYCIHEAQNAVKFISCWIWNLDAVAEEEDSWFADPYFDFVWVISSIQSYSGQVYCANETILCHKRCIGFTVRAVKILVELII